MTTPEVNVITGAFSYTGKYITRRLLNMGSAPIHPCNAAGSRLPLRGQQGCKEKEVRTLTGHPNNPSPFGDAVKAGQELAGRDDSLQHLLDSLCAWLDDLR